MSENDEKRVYKESERVFYEQLESTLEAGMTEIAFDEQRYKVRRGRGEDWVPYFVLEPIEPS